MRNSQNETKIPVAPLDEIDRRIVAELQVEGRRSYTKIAADLGVSESVVRFRVQRLEREGVLQIVGIADPFKIGFELMTLLGVRIVPGQLKSVVKALEAFPETSYVATVAGGFDLFVEIVCRDTAHFNELLTGRLQNIPGIAETTSFMILEIHKMAYGWGVGGISTPLANDGTEATTAELTE